MANVSQEQLARAKQVYATIKQVMDSHNWSYDENEDELYIKTGVKGEDLPMGFIVEVIADREIVRFMSLLPVEIPEDKRIDTAIAMCKINEGFVNGNFDYDIKQGHVYYRRAVCYRGDPMPKASVYDYLIDYSLSVVDDYNDKLADFAEGKITFEQLMQTIG